MSSKIGSFMSNVGSIVASKIKPKSATNTDTLKALNDIGFAQTLQNITKKVVDVGLYA